MNIARFTDIRTGRIKITPLRKRDRFPIQYKVTCTNGWWKIEAKEYEGPLPIGKIPDKYELTFKDKYEIVFELPKCDKNMTDIIFFDLETTGADPETDRIVQLAAIKWNVATQKASGLKEILINPGMPISKSATEVHGITDEMVADKPLFSSYAKSLFEYFEGCILGGYNIRHFDVPIIVGEFARCGIALTAPAIYDSYKIFTLKEKRDLSAANLFYLNNTLQDAHDAGADTIAAMNIFQEQMTRYPDLAEMSPEELDIFCNSGVKSLDLAGKIYINKDGLPTYSFGTKTKDVPVKDNIQFAHWMLNNKFPEDTKRVLRAIIDNLI